MKARRRFPLPPVNYLEFEEFMALPKKAQLSAHLFAPDELRKKFPALRRVWRSIVKRRRGLGLI